MHWISKIVSWLSSFQSSLVLFGGVPTSMLRWDMPGEPKQDSHEITTEFGRLMKVLDFYTSSVFRLLEFWIIVCCLSRNHIFIFLLLCYIHIFSYFLVFEGCLFVFIPVIQLMSLNYWCWKRDRWSFLVFRMHRSFFVITFFFPLHYLIAIIFCWKG